jgi:hypothetical protein
MNALESAWESSKRDFGGESSETDGRDPRRITAELNQIFRRLRQYQNEEQWVTAVGDGLQAFATTFALFTVQGGTLRVRAQRNISLPEGSEFPLVSARALAAAVESRDSLVALRTRSEVGEQLCQTDAIVRAQIVPVTNDDRVVALIFADQANDETREALELIAGMASAVLARSTNRGLHTQISTVAAVSEQKKAAQDPPLQMQPNLSLQEKLLHSRAQRFSRVAIAKIQLAHPEACRPDGEQENLYMLLRTEIDRARDEYQKQFMTTPRMTDYLHRELIENVAHGDETRLGADYPGELA